MDAVRLARHRGELDNGGLEVSAVSGLRVSEKRIEVKLGESGQVLETLWKPLDTEKTQCGAPLYQTVRQCESCHAILRNFSSDG